MSDPTTPQSLVAASVARRGYRTGWTAAQFLARQVAKAQEELGEMALCIDLDGKDPATVLGSIAVTGKLARQVFDNRSGWKRPAFVDCATLMAEAADLQVVLFNIASVIQEITKEPFSIVDEAIKKAAADEHRSVRGEG